MTNREWMNGLSIMELTVLLYMLFAKRPPSADEATAFCVWLSAEYKEPVKKQEESK